MNTLNTGRVAALLVILLTTGPSITAATLTFHSRVQTLFGGREQDVSFSLRNAASTPVTDTVHYRLFQLSHRLIVPHGDGVEWNEVTLPADSGNPFAIRLAIPQVKARTRFKLALFAGDESRLGTVELIVLPDNLLAPLKALARRERVGLWDPGDRLRPTLEKLGIRPLNLATRWNAEDFTGDLLIAVHARDDRDRLNEKNATFAILKRRGVAVICLLQAPRPDLPLPLIAAGDARDGTLVYAPLREVAALATASAQLRLSQFIDFARSREPISLLNQYEE